MKKIVALVFLCLTAAYCFPCTTFLLSKNGRHVFGRNYDWVSGNGMVIVNARGVAKTSFMPPDGRAISWVSGYGSVTFNQFGKEFPHGGMNERGLVVEMMWLSGTAYPEEDERASMNELQWIQYQLDNCANIAEVIATDKKIRISRAGAAPLHYLVADASGKAATIEFIDGKMVVHQGSDLSFPVLTNTLYTDAQKQVRTQKDSKASFKDNSVERFSTACKMVQQYQANDSKEAPVDYAFNILDKVAQKNFTKWSIVYDLTNKEVHFITSNQTQRKSLSLLDFNFACNTPALAFSLSDTKAGGISKEFATLSFEQNKKLIEQSAQESSSEIQVSPASQARAAAYFRQVTCRQP